MRTWRLRRANQGVAYACPSGAGPQAHQLEPSGNENGLLPFVLHRLSMAPSGKQCRVRTRSARVETSFRVGGASAGADNVSAGADPRETCLIVRRRSRGSSLAGPP